MSQQVIKLSTNAAERIKEIMSKAKDKAIGVRVGVKSGGCAGMSYIMEYAKDIKPNEEIVEDKGVKVLIDPKAIMYLLGTEMDYKKEKFSSQAWVAELGFDITDAINFAFQTVPGRDDISPLGILTFQANPNLELLGSYDSNGDWKSQVQLFFRY